MANYNTSCIINTVKHKSKVDHHINKRHRCISMIESVSVEKLERLSESKTGEKKKERNREKKE